MLPRLRRSHRPRAAGSLLNDTMTLLKDGSITYSSGYRNMTAKDVERLIDKTLRQGVYSLGGFTKLDPEYTRFINQLVDDIQKHGIKLGFFLAPYPQEVYRTFKIRYPMPCRLKSWPANWPPSAA